MLDPIRRPNGQHRSGPFHVDQQGAMTDKVGGQVRLDCELDSRRSHRPATNADSGALVPNKRHEKRAHLPRMREILMGIFTCSRRVTQ